MATPTNLAKNARMTAQRDQLNGGALVLLTAGGAVLGSFGLAATSGAVAGAGVLTFAGFPKTVSALATGALSRAELRTAGGAVSEILTVGEDGDPAGPFDVVVSTTNIQQVGQALSVLNTPSLTHPAGN